MANFEKMFLQVRAGCDVVPTPGQQAAGSVKLRQDLQADFSQMESAWAARVWLPRDNTVHALANLLTGSLTASTAGTRQLRRTTVSGAMTGTGILNVTVTGALLSQALTVNVSLSPQVASNMGDVAAIIAATLAQRPELEFYQIYADGIFVYISPRIADVQDTALGIAWPPGLGINGASSAADTINGVKGTMLERLGGATADALGRTLPTSIGTDSVLILHNRSFSQGAVRILKNSDSSVLVPPISPGGFCVIDKVAEFANVLKINCLTSSACCADLMILNRS